MENKVWLFTFAPKGIFNHVRPHDHKHHIAQCMSYYLWSIKTHQITSHRNLLSSEHINFCHHHAVNDRCSIFDIEVVIFISNQELELFSLWRHLQIFFVEGINPAGEWSLLDLVQSPTVDRYFPSRLSASSMCLALETIRLHYNLLSKLWKKMCNFCSVIPIWWSKVRLFLTTIWKSAVKGWKLRS
jgi:hypothetical protein